MLVFGTRPEAIKMCPVAAELLRRELFDVKICLSGQHKEMMHGVLDAFNIKADYDLEIMKDASGLCGISARIIERFGEVLEGEKPDIVLVHGDTSTAFSAALACFYCGVPIAHIEAGLRTGNIYSPYPEEFNRCAISLISRLNFAPTEAARDNLQNEGVEKESIFVVGNTAIDALFATVRAGYMHPILDMAEGKRLVLLTAHRRESIGEPMREIFRGIRRAVLEHGDVLLVYPMHKNPRVREIAESELGGCERIILTEPLDVIDFHNITARCSFVLSDSGGIQEEAPALGKPVLVLRETTERPEGVSAGTLRLIGCKEQGVYEGFCELLDNGELYKKMSCAENPYGDGRASIYISDILTDFLTK